jgi:hypothetical protein
LPADGHADAVVAARVAAADAAVVGLGVEELAGGDVADADREVRLLRHCGTAALRRRPSQPGCRR